MISRRSVGSPLYLPEARDNIAWSTTQKCTNLCPITVARLWGTVTPTSGARRHTPEESYNLGEVCATCRPLRQRIITGILHRALLLSTTQGIDFYLGLRGAPHT